MSRGAAAHQHELDAVSRAHLAHKRPDAGADFGEAALELVQQRCQLWYVFEYGRFLLGRQLPAISGQLLHLHPLHSQAALLVGTCKPANVQ